MVDRDLVTRKIALIVDDLRAITSIAQKPLDDYLAPPRDYYESFTQPAKLGVLPPAFASQIAACAGLRNRIIHEYDEIDPRRVYEGLQAAVRDIPEYLRRVHEHLERIA